MSTTSTTSTTSGTSARSAARPHRPGRRSARWLTAAVLVAVAALGTASAATLAVTSAGRSSTVTAHPCPGTATATAAGPGGTSFGSVSLTAPPGCGGRQVQVTLLSGSTVVASGAAALPAGASGTVPVTPSYAATAALTARATVSGWDLPVTWSYTPHVSCRFTDSSGQPCTAVVSVFSGVKPGGSITATYYDVVVSTTSTTARPWEVTFVLNHPFFATTATRLGNSTLDGYTDSARTWDGVGNNVVRTSACSALPGSLVVVGVSSGGGANGDFRNVRSGTNRERRFSLVVDRTDPGYFDVVSPGCT